MGNLEGGTALPWHHPDITSINKGYLTVRDIHITHQFCADLTKTQLTGYDHCQYYHILFHSFEFINVHSVRNYSNHLKCYYPC